MKAIVFGGSGFIGSHVVEQLKLAGHEVTAAARETSNVTFLESIGVKVVKLDFLNKEELGAAIHGHEVVYNCTADTKMDPQKDVHEQNEFILSKNLLEVASANGALKFIHLSTIVVYDFRTGEPIDESYITEPDYPIQFLKLAIDQNIQESGRKLGISTLILRPASTIGSRDKKSFFSRMFAAHNSNQFPLVGKGNTKVSIVDTRDIGRAMVFLGEFQKPEEDNGLYHLKGFDTTWAELKKEIDMAAGRIAQTIELSANDPSFAGKTLAVNRVWNDDKIRKAGFYPIYNLKDSVMNSVQELSNLRY